MHMKIMWYNVSSREFQAKIPEKIKKVNWKKISLRLQIQYRRHPNYIPLWDFPSRLREVHVNLRNAKIFFNQNFKCIMPGKSFLNMKNVCIKPNDKHLNANLVLKLRVEYEKNLSNALKS